MASRVRLLPKVLLGLVLFACAMGVYLYMKNTGHLPVATTDTAGSAPEHFSNPGSPVGTAGNPLKIGINSFHGWGPAIVANGNALTTQPGSIYANSGVNVQFIIQDDYPTLATIFTANTAHCSWRTSDSWAQEHPNLRNNNLDGKAVLIADNTQGADAIVARDPNIKSVEDLADHSIALLQFTPAQGLLTYALNNSALSSRKRSTIKSVYINADEGTTGVLAALTGGHVDAAALWDPDLSTAIKNGAHVVYSTKIANNLIYDVIVCNTKYLNDPNNRGAFKALVTGWMEGVDQVNANPDLAVNAITKTMEYYSMLAKDRGLQFVRGLYGNLLLTNLTENIRILGLAGGTNHYERVYKDFDIIYRNLGTLSNPNSPVINPSDSFDYQFIQGMMNAQPSARAEAQKPVYTFTEAQGTQVATTHTPTVTKPVVINFETNSFALNHKAEDTLDKEVAPLVETYGSAYFEISGNTDSTGSDAINQKISLARAKSVAAYLAKEWDFPKERFIVKGNGSSKPLCDEKNPDGTLEECRAQNRTTRVAVIAR